MAATLDILTILVMIRGLLSYNWTCKRLDEIMRMNLHIMEAYAIDDPKLASVVLLPFDSELTHFFGMMFDLFKWRYKSYFPKTAEEIFLDRLEAYHVANPVVK